MGIKKCLTIIIDFSRSVNDIIIIIIVLTNIWDYPIERFSSKYFSRREFLYTYINVHCWLF